MLRLLNRVVYFLSRHSNLVAAVCVVLLLEALLHARSLAVLRPSQALDAPFASGCREPDVSGPRANATVVMLARNSDRRGAVDSIRSFEDQFNRWFHYPIVFLNDKPWDKEFVDALTKVASGKVQFELIEPSMWGFPEWIDQEDAKKSIAAQGKKGIIYAGLESYHHMCRFNSGKFYDHPALKPYKWYWRIEPDVQFTCAITYDPFLEMAKHKKKYGYTVALWEVGKTSPSLFRKVADYKKLQKIASSGLWKSMVDASWAPFPIRPLLAWLAPHRDSSGDAWNFCHYWSNFEIADMDFFRSNEYRNFFDMLDEDGGFYYERWGDAPVHSFAAALFLEPQEVHHFLDFGYVHGDFQVGPGNAYGEQLPHSSVLGQGTWDKELAGGIGCRCRHDRSKEKPDGFCFDKLRQPVQTV